MSKLPRPSFAAAAVADITGSTPPPSVHPDHALWPNAGIIRVEPPVDKDQKSSQKYKDDKLGKDEKDIKTKKITFSNKLEAPTYLKLQQLATYSGENIQEILEAALTAYFAGKEEAFRPLPPKIMAALRNKYPFL